MKNKDFTTSIAVGQSPREAFNAINNPRGWWSEKIEGITDRIDAEWTYQYKDAHRCQLKIVELVPDKRVVWLVTDNYFNFIKDKAEWIDTRLVFEISSADDKTKVKFTHEGLVPSYECYEICEEAWSDYIKRSLHGLITKGKGDPNVV